MKDTRPHKIVLLSVLVIFSLGCISEFAVKTCPNDNPCIKTYYNKTIDRCIAVKKTGPVSGCSVQAGCLSYQCVNGICLAEQKRGCCGNHICEEGETTSCNRDCKTSCNDGLKNQGEKGIDCGGPCKPCIADKDNQLKQLGTFYNEYQDNIGRYANAIDSYNSDQGKERLRVVSTDIRQGLTHIQNKFSRIQPKKDLIHAYSLFNNSINAHVKSLDSMIKFSELEKIVDLKKANEHLSDARSKEQKFVEEYNRLVRKYNTLIQNCQNNILDEEEERIDCGEVCSKPCSVRYNITKIVSLKNMGYETKILLNITPPAIDHMPSQKLISSLVKPKPNNKIVDEKGNTVYEFNFSLPRYNAFEISITNEVELYSGLDSAQVKDKFMRGYLSEDTYTKLTDEICSQASIFKKDNNTETVSEIYDWMTDNIKYFANDKQYSSSITFEMKVGACDEHANLFNAMARCNDIYSRKISGYLVNATEVIGHAWNEYFDGGWRYIDASSKNEDGFITDNQHITSCIVDGPKSCSTTYIFTYTKRKKPEISFSEEVYLS